MEEVIGSTPIFSTKPDRTLSGFFIMYHTYIIFSEKLNKFYVGATEDLDRRLVEHNTGRSPYTKTG